MGKFLTVDNSNVVKYEALTNKPFGQVLALEQKLNFIKFQFGGQTRCVEVFYDTPNDILYKAGVILSRIQEGDNAYFKICQVPSNRKLKLSNTQKVFSHKIDPKDTLKDHAFYLMDGISGIFSTPIYNDLENIIKNAIPKIIITTDATIYNVIGGSGLRAVMCHEQIKYENRETKNKHKTLNMTIKLTAKDQYEKEYKEFNENIKKYCKDFIEVDEEPYEHAKILTRKIDKKQAKLDAKKAKEMIQNKKLEGEGEEE